MACGLDMNAIWPVGRNCKKTPRNKVFTPPNMRGSCVLGSYLYRFFDGTLVLTLCSREPIVSAPVRATRPPTRFMHPPIYPAVHAPVHLSAHPPVNTPAQVKILPRAVLPPVHPAGQVQSQRAQENLLFLHLFFQHARPHVRSTRLYTRPYTRQHTRPCTLPSPLPAQVQILPTAVHSPVTPPA